MGDPKASTKPESRGRRRLAWLLLAAALVLVAAVRLRLLGLPLERDEGEFAYIGQLMLHGIPPYKLAANMKFPGIYTAYALIMAIFGKSITGIHLGYFLMDAATIVMVFILGRRLFDSLTGSIASASYGVLSLGRGVLGLAAHATHFVVFFALWALLLLLKAIESGRLKTYFGSGLLFGLALLMKQPGVFFGIFAAGYVIWSETRSRPIAWRLCISRLGVLAAGIAIPFGLACLILWLTGAFPKFWFWAFQYAKQYASATPLSRAFDHLIVGANLTMSDSPLLWMLALTGLVFLLRTRELRSRAVFVVGLLIFSFAGVCPDLYFREHYWVLLLPAAALLIGIGVCGISRLLENAGKPARYQAIPALLFCAAVIYPLYNQGDVFFQLTPPQASRAIYGGNPFPESIEVAKYLKDHTDPQDTIAVVGSEPQIYFYADRPSATEYMYTYGLVEVHKYSSRMQFEMIHQIETAKPKYVVWLPIAVMKASWLPKFGYRTTIVEWAQDYLTRYYDLAGVIDISNNPDPSQTVYAWESEASLSNMDASHLFFVVFKRKPGA